MNTYTRDNYTYTFGITGDKLEITIVNNDTYEKYDWFHFGSTGPIYNFCKVERNYLDMEYLFNNTLNKHTIFEDHLALEKQLVLGFKNNSINFSVSPLPIMSLTVSLYDGPDKKIVYTETIRIQFTVSMYTVKIKAQEKQIKTLEEKVKALEETIANTKNEVEVTKDDTVCSLKEKLFIAQERKKEITDKIQTLDQTIRWRENTVVISGTIQK